MKRGINAWSFPAGMSQKDAMRLAAKTGYDSFELSLDAEGELSLHSSDEEIKSFRALADAACRKASSRSSDQSHSSAGGR